MRERERDTDTRRGATQTSIAVDGLELDGVVYRLVQMSAAGAGCLLGQIGLAAAADAAAAASVVTDSRLRPALLKCSANTSRYDPPDVALTAAARGDL